MIPIPDALSALPCDLKASNVIATLHGMKVIDYEVVDLPPLNWSSECFVRRTGDE